MKQTIRILTAVMLLAVVIIPAAVFGASSSVSISGGGTAEVGKTVTVTVTYKGDSLGYVNGQMTYDNNKLQYVSGGSSQGDAGLVQLKEYSGVTSGKISFKVKFKAVGDGDVKLNLETLETQNVDGDQNMGAPSASKTVKVTAAQSTTEATQESTDEETTTEETTEETAAPTETQETLAAEGAADLKQDETKSGINYPLLVCIAVVMIALIAVILWKLRGKKKRR